MSIKRIACPATLDQQTGQSLLEAVRKQPITQGEAVVLDLSGTTRMDPRGGAWLVAIAGHVSAHRGELRCEGHSGEVAEFIDLIEPGLKIPPKRADTREGFFEEIGDLVLRAVDELRDFGRLLVDAIYWLVIATLFDRRGFRWGLWMDEMYEMGVRAVRINCLMNFLLGLIIAMLSAAQVAQYGLSIYVANLIIIGFARELAAVMTAVVVSARTGAAITAELATMVVQEEIDALRGMGLNVAQFLVVPKILALLIVMPCLAALGLIAGVLGGSLWGVAVLGFDPANWMNQTLHAAKLSDVMQGMLKALAFAIMIVLVGCHNGLRVKGGSRGVGLMTTRAVVMDIFFIIVIDIIFATIFYYILDVTTWTT
jgi:phospholipid/cholesterol/gamma-HCH transport system permease protein